MDRKYSGEQILDALSEVGIGAGDISEVMGYLGRMSLAELNNNSTELDSKSLNNIVLKLCEGISCNECSFNEIDGVPGCLLVERIEDLASTDPELVNDSTEVNRENDKLNLQSNLQPTCNQLATDLVSRNYLLSEYDRQHKGPAGVARKIIEDAPSVESKIVRCKDCKWWWQREVKINLCPGGGLLTDGEWFCGNAERINDE